MTTTTPLDILNTKFGFHTFRGEQESIINHILAGGNALVLMPTGGGKSLCYQIPALLRPGVAIIISPLIALMQDQVSALLQFGVRAAFFNSTLSPEQAQRVTWQLRQGELDLLYVSPERLMTTWFLEFLESLNIALFAIDEAHCVSRWGHDFRKEYTQLSVIAQRFPNIPRIALTATADEPTRRDIILHFGLENAKIFISSFDRPNIRYTVIQKSDNMRRTLLNFLNTEHRGDAGIIYCLTRKKVDEMATWLQAQGWNAFPYHAELPTQMRTHHQERFLREEGVIIVATIAFGLGIDKPNVRFVAHLDLPRSLEAYYQETGRAGRDGLPANAWMAYGLQEVIMLRRLIGVSDAEEQHKRIEQRKLEDMLGFCELATCRRQNLLAYLGEQLTQPCGNCDNCLEPVETYDGTAVAQKALSCIYRTGQRFGVHYLIDVLLGKTSDKIKKFRHDQVSTFGIGQELSMEQWFSVYRQLIAAGFVKVDVEGYGGLQLVEKARPLLRGEQRIYLRKDLAVKRPKKLDRAERKYQRTTLSSATFMGTDRLLWEALRTRRLELANVQNVPPYIIFHDSTLTEIVQYRPRTLSEFAKLSGVGARKLELYGLTFIDVVEAHILKYGEPSPPPIINRVAEEGERDREDMVSPERIETIAVSEIVLPERIEVTLDALRNGLSPAEIAQQREIQVSTVYSYLSEAIEAGRLELGELINLSAGEIEEIEDAFLSLPEDLKQSVKPVFEKFAGQYSYDVLRCVRANLWREVKCE